MIFQIISYIILFIFSILYTTFKYSNLFDIIFCNIMIIFFYGFLFYHYPFLGTNFKKIILSIFLAFLLSLFTFEQIGHPYKEKTLQIQNISDQIITIDAIYKDGEKQKTNMLYKQKYDLINQANLNTSYQRYNKTTGEYKATLEPNCVYTLDIQKTKNIQVEFQRISKPYKLQINDQTITIDSMQEGMTPKAQKIFHSNYDFKYNNISSLKWDVKTVSIFLLLLFLYFNLFMRVLYHKNGILIVLFSLLTEFNPFIHIHIITKLCLFIAYFLFLLRYDQPWTFTNKKEKILILFSSFYLSFSFFGNYLLQDTISFKTIMIFLLFWLWMMILFPYILNFLDRIKVKHQNKKRSSLCLWKHRLILFILIVTIGILYQLIFYPYIVPPDGYMQLSDIQSNTLSNWHPYLHTLLIKLFVILFSDAKYFIVFRMIVYAMILIHILFYFYNKNLSLKKIYIIAIFLTIFPVTGIFLVTMWKDVDFTLALVYLIFNFYLIICDFPYFHKYKHHYIWLTFSLIAVGGFRHNGLLIVAVSAFFLLFLSIRKKHIFLGIVGVVSISFLLAMNGPVKNILQVEKGPRNVDISTILHGFDRLIYLENKEIDPDALSYLLKYMPLEKWKVSYDRYNIDLLLHYTDYDIRELKINKKHLIFLYLKQMTKTPIELLKDRLYGIDLIWNVSEKDNLMTYKYQIYYDEFESNYSAALGIKNHQNIYMNFINDILIKISNHEILNTFFFRVGIYMDLFIVLITYIILKKKKKILCIFLPFLINLFTLFLVMHHYEYRYVWNVYLIILLFLLIFIYDLKNPLSRKEK